MTNEEKKNWLCLYSASKRRIERYQEIIKEIDEMKSNPLDSMEIQTQREEELLLALFESSVKDRCKQCEAVCYEVVKCVEGMGEGKEQDVIGFRYIMGMTWKQIAAIMMYSVGHVQKLHAKALEGING